jgi:hypothetical protein
VCPPSTGVSRKQAHGLREHCIEGTLDTRAGIRFNRGSNVLILIIILLILLLGGGGGYYGYGRWGYGGGFGVGLGTILMTLLIASYWGFFAEHHQTVKPEVRQA